VVERDLAGLGAVGTVLAGRPKQRLPGLHVRPAKLPGFRLTNRDRAVL